VLVKVTEAYIHCSKHIPKLVSQSRVRHWGTDNPRHKGGDYFGATAQKLAEPEAGPVPIEAAEDGPVPIEAAEERSMCRSHQRPRALQLASKDRPQS
jgi:hypothetical protein